ncbi:class I SAM-dependent methyltransferase [Kribbella sancticallisti]|uniref:Class I SAM-dependent methyltransferase n=1 Tax=Kribbella sancticallisti TaxID=460087 RepID=A0ABP4PNV5_9ACTN
MDEIRRINKAVWSAGEWDEVAALIAAAGPRLLDEVPVGAGMEVLDVATGSGSSVAIQAALRGATVTASDLTPAHFEAGRRRAADAGVSIDWVEADAEDLPFDDGRFDRVFSTFGHMFAPDQQRAADELVRVCKPGGIVALATWTPAGYSGQLFGVIDRHLPPSPETRSPVLWGDPEEVTRLLPGLDLDFHLDHILFKSPSAEARVRFYEEKFGPLVMARQVLGDRWPELRADVVAFDEEWNTATDGTLEISAEYLVTIGRKPA